jgi:hypothetical protein
VTSAAAASTELTCRGIRITDAAIEELSGNSVAASVPRAEVLGLEIGYGRVGERPVATTLLALVIMGLGLVMARHLIQWLRYGGTAHDFEAYGIALIPLGGWMLRAVWRRSRLLFITTRRERRRFAFARGTTDEELVAFHARAQPLLGGIPFTLRLER